MVHSRLYNLYKIAKNLGFLEERVLGLVDINGSSPREIVDCIEKRFKKKYAYTTIMTVLDKLYKKNYLTRKKIKKTYYYFPIKSQTELEEFSSLYLVNSLIKIISVKKVFYYLFIVILSYLLVFLIKKTFYQGLVKMFFYSIFVCTIINSFYSLYLNGGFDYLLFLLTNPTFFINNVSVNLMYLGETFFYFVFLLILVLGYLFSKAIIKKSYQLDIFYGKTTISY